MLKLIHRNPIPSVQAIALRKALEERGVRVLVEINDGFKSIDLGIPKAKLNIEIDGIQHLTNPHQIVADLARGYYSHKLGFDTMHIPNEMIHLHLKEIADALAEASKIRERKIYLHVD
jgi:very-short-patch-repair endonuclease